MTASPSLVQRGLLNRTVDKPQMFGWVELSEPDNLGYRHLKLAFGYGEGHVRSVQTWLGDEAGWSHPTTFGIEIAGATEVVLRHDIQPYQVINANLRTIWEPDHHRMSLCSADDVFSGVFRNADYEDRLYFDNIEELWLDVAIRLQDAGLEKWLPYIYLDVALSSKLQLDQFDYASVGALAGSFDCEGESISTVTNAELVRLEIEVLRLRELHDTIAFLAAIPPRHQGDLALGAHIRSATQLLLLHADEERDHEWVALRLLRMKPIDKFSDNADTLAKRIEYLETAIDALKALRVAEDKLVV